MSLGPVNNTARSDSPKLPRLPDDGLPEKLLAALSSKGNGEEEERFSRLNALADEALESQSVPPDLLLSFLEELADLAFAVEAPSELQKIALNGLKHVARAETDKQLRTLGLLGFYGLSTERSSAQDLERVQKALETGEAAYKRSREEGASDPRLSIYCLARAATAIELYLQHQILSVIEDNEFTGSEYENEEDERNDENRELRLAALTQAKIWMQEIKAGLPIPERHLVPFANIAHMTALGLLNEGEYDGVSNLLAWTAILCEGREIDSHWFAELLTTLAYTCFVTKDLEGCGNALTELDGYREIFPNLRGELAGTLFTVRALYEAASGRLSAIDAGARVRELVSNDVESLGAVEWVVNRALETYRGLDPQSSSVRKFIDDYLTFESEVDE